MSFSIFPERNIKEIIKGEYDGYEERCPERASHMAAQMGNQNFNAIINANAFNMSNMK